MICTKCGTDNDDWQRFCRDCGNKLQSEQGDPAGTAGQAGQPEPGGAKDRGSLFSFLDKPASGGGMGRYLEAWAYALGFIALGFALIRLDLGWLLYLLVPLAALALRFRGL